MRDLARSLLEKMPELTVRRSAEAALANARENQGHAGQSILDLATPAGDGPAIVVSAGPSLHRRDPAGVILARGSSHTIVAVDAALGYCLRNGVVPDYVLSLDPHPTRICRWFGDPELEQHLDDDYFRRQELDPYLRSREFERNEELLALVDHHGASIRAALGTSVAPNVRDRCLQAGMDIFWWNPMLDDVGRSDSLTRQLHRMNGLPAMATGGNVGSAAWVFSHQLLGCDPVVLVGMDFGYPPGTSLEHTQYFVDLEALFGERAAEAYIEVHNPYLGETWLADPTYYWYRQSFLEMAKVAPCLTVNCTEGGTLFGEGIEIRSLGEQLVTESSRENDGAFR